MLQGRQRSQPLSHVLDVSDVSPRRLRHCALVEAAETTPPLRPPVSFADYLRDLYYKDDRVFRLPWVPKSSYHISVTPDDVVEALRRLSTGKALGTDQLSDNYVRAALT